MSVDGYDELAPLPIAGSRWVWEIDLPHARALVEVREVTWNGEEWWVKTKLLLPNWTYPVRESEVVNDLGRFWEACQPVGGTARRFTCAQTTNRRLIAEASRG